jgi:hypothetical protein
MKVRQYLLIVVLTIVSGLVGGAVSNRVFMATAANAQETDKITVDTLVTKELLIIDDSDDIRAQLTLVEGDVGLVFYDKGLKGRSLFSMNDQFNGIRLFDNQGRLRLHAGVDSDNGPSIVLFDKHKKLRAVLGYAQLGTENTGAIEKLEESSLVLFDGEGNTLRRIP